MKQFYTPIEPSEEKIMTSAKFSDFRSIFSPPPGFFNGQYPMFI